MILAPFIFTDDGSYFFKWNCQNHFAYCFQTDSLLAFHQVTHNSSNFISSTLLLFPHLFTQWLLIKSLQVKFIPLQKANVSMSIFKVLFQVGEKDFFLH